MNNHQTGKIAFMDFGGHLILNMLEYEDSSPSKMPTRKNPSEKEHKRFPRYVSSEIPF